ncbi:MAG: CvpA family protein [Clostridia bacterium]|nr:CvpA family protein [Clostridia bacterium]
MNWLDLGIIVLVVIFLIIGIKRGLMRSVLSHFTLGTNCLISFFASRPIGWLYDKIFNISGKIAGSYSSKLLEASADFGTNLIGISNDSLSGFVSSTINKSGFSRFTNWLLNLFINKGSLYSELNESGKTSRTLSEIISEGLGSFYLKLISFVTSIILIYLIVWLFKLLADKLRKNGAVKVVDSVLGVVYGLVRAFIILVIICVVIKLISPLSFMGGVIEYINGSLFGKLIYSQVNSFMDNYLNFSDLIRSIFGR